MIECLPCQFENSDNAQNRKHSSAVQYSVESASGIAAFRGSNVGQVLKKRYVVIRKSGKDAIGTLYQAEDTELGRTVEIRILPKIISDSEQEINELRREAKTVCNLSHPNIVSLLGFQLSQPVKYLVTEYIDGVSLEERISREGPLSVEEMLRIFVQVAAGLDYAHSMNALHRDIRPANIVLTHTGVAKLANFAVTRQIIDSMARISTEGIGNSWLYTSPEQFRTGKAEQRSDIYSLAASIYQCLCDAPTCWRGWMEYQVLQEKPSPLDKLSDKQNVALLKALSRDPADRQSSALELLAELGARTQAIIEAKERAVAESQAAKIAELEKALKTEAKVRANAEQQARAYVEANRRAQEQTREIQKKYARVIADKREELRAEAEARAKAEAEIKKCAAKIAQTEEKVKSYAEELARAEERLNAETEARIIAEQQVRTYAKRLAQAEANSRAELKTVERTRERPAAHSETIAEIEDQAKESTPKVRTLVAVFFPTALIISVVLIGHQYAKHRRATVEARKLWTEAQLSAGQHNYADAIITANAIITKFPEYAKEQKVQSFKTTWENTVSVRRQIATLLAKAKKAKDTNELNTALETVASVLAIDYDSPPSKSVKTQKEPESVKAALPASHAPEPAQIESSKLLRLASEAEAQGNLAKAIEWYHKAADAGNSDAMFHLGILYYEGKGVAKDYAAAMEWLLKAAKKGNNTAMFNVATMYHEGEGVTEDHAKSLTWYRKAAEAGNSRAMFNLAMMYYEGDGVTKDYAKAIEWLTKAADKGNSMAMFNLGMMYYKGSGIPQDYARAVSWYGKAAEVGDSRAMSKLALAYYNGYGVPKDHQKAVEWYRKAAQAGDSEAMYNLGVMYYNGDGVAKDEAKAIEWFGKAAEAGDSEAMYVLGLAYHNGVGLTKDYTKAVEWYRKAAQAGEAIAMYSLGVMYHSGDGVAKDTEQAIHWFQRAARLGYKKAEQELGKLGKTW